MPDDENAGMLPEPAIRFEEDRHSPRELENRLTRLETTIHNFRWVLGMGLVSLGIIVPFVIYLLETART